MNDVETDKEIHLIKYCIADMVKLRRVVNDLIDKEINKLSEAEEIVNARILKE